MDYINHQSLTKEYRFLFSVAGAVILFDQLTKLLIRLNLGQGQVWAPSREIERFVRLVFWKNTGAAFGIFQSAGSVFAVLAVFVTLAIINYYPIIPSSERFMRAALALQMGGAVGNLIDRLTLGYVTDFISVGRFPVFNVADAAISTGLVLILIPYAAILPDEISRWLIRRQAHSINVRHREAPLIKISHEEEPISLGVLELFLDDSPRIRQFLLVQRVRFIRGRRQNRVRVKRGRS